MAASRRGGPGVPGWPRHARVFPAHWDGQGCGRGKSCCTGVATAPRGGFGASMSLQRTEVSWCTGGGGLGAASFLNDVLRRRKLILMCVKKPEGGYPKFGRFLMRACTVRRQMLSSSSNSLGSAQTLLAYYVTLQKAGRGVLSDYISEKGGDPDFTLARRG